LGWLAGPCALVVQSILYWLIYAIVWGPTVGFKRSLGHIASWDVVLLTAIYSLFWIVACGRRVDAASSRYAPP
jgi:hypothetical protein